MLYLVYNISGRESKCVQLVQNVTGSSLAHAKPCHQVT